MSCCGKKLVQTTHKMAQIVKGNYGHLMQKMRLLPKEKCEAADKRLRVCRTCESCTWITWAEYCSWIDGHGGKVQFLKDIDSLESWPLLPKQVYDRHRKLFCRICKCWLPAKAFVKEQQCPKGYWKATDNC